MFSPTRQPLRKSAATSSHNGAQGGRRPDPPPPPARRPPGPPPGEPEPRPPRQQVDEHRIGEGTESPMFPWLKKKWETPKPSRTSRSRLAIRRSLRQSQRPMKKSRQSGIQMNGEFSEWANSPE